MGCAKLPRICQIASAWGVIWGVIWGVKVKNTISTPSLHFRCQKYVGKGKRWFRLDETLTLRVGWGVSMQTCCISFKLLFAQASAMPFQLI